MSTKVFTLDPLADPRWDDLVSRHPGASLFHTRGWLEALQRTYGYEPVVLTTTGSGPLENGLVLCRVRTWLSRRLVSLPFSDHCEPLTHAPGDLEVLCEAARAEVKAGHWRSCEIRPRHAVAAGIEAGRSYLLHELDLSRPAAQVFAGFHPSSTRRAIRKAEREGVECEVGTSDAQLTAFYALLRRARRRHGVPPQPMAWFRNLRACLRDALAVYVARKGAVPIAAILTIAFRDTLTYKYGGSDARHHALGAMPLLFWRAIERAQAAGVRMLDLGRSDLDQPGLVAFKEHLGATPRELTYYTFPRAPRRDAAPGMLTRAARQLLARLPDPALDLTGRIVYRHLG